VLCAALDGGVVRFVTHLDVSDADVDTALEICVPLLR
jgi:threonine aldolase